MVELIDKLCVCWKCLNVHLVSQRIPCKEKFDVSHLPNRKSTRTECPKCGGRTIMGTPVDTKEF